MTRRTRHTDRTAGPETEQTSASTLVTVVGTGSEAETWARALRGVDGVAVERLDDAGDGALLRHLEEVASTAVVFPGDAPDLPSALRQVAMAGRHALVTGPVALASKQLLSLDELARRRRLTLMFDAGTLADERLAFARRMTAGPHALWRPRYIRSMRTGRHGEETLDQLAIADVHAVLSLTEATPERVSAVAPRIDEETGAADAAMTTVVFDDGLVAQTTVSFVEPGLRQELVVACDGRTIVLDGLDARAPLRIEASARHAGPRQGQWAETVMEHPVGVMTDRTAGASAAFVGAVRARDAAANNGADLARAARAWETARTSMARGGEYLPVRAADAGTGRRPPLEVIEGGGQRTGGGADLRVVGGP